MNYTFQIYFLLFISYSILGWIMEVILTCIKSKKFVNRGFLIGPYCPIYGWGALLITILLRKYTSDIVALFALGMILCAILEYFTSYLLEKIFKARWWDYSTKKFNINGRICLNTMIPFGLLGVIMMRIINPTFLSIYNSISPKNLSIIVIIILVIYLIDNIISISILISVRKENKALDKDNTEEMSRLVHDKIISMGWGYKRLLSAFPNVRHIAKLISKENIKMKNYKKYNYMNIKDDAEVVKNWEPLKFEINDNYKYVSKNIIFNFFSNVLCFIVAIILSIFDRLLYGYKVINKKNIVKNSGFVSISNHIHWMDCTFVGLMNYPHRIYFPTLASNFKIPVIRHIIKLLYAIPIPKTNNQKEIFYNTINDLLKEGKIVHMYPEGSLWPYYDKVRNFKYGAFKMAVEANVPIQPIVFKYVNKWYKRKPAIVCEILKPIYPNNKLKKEERIKDLKNRSLKEMRKSSENINIIL